MERQKNAFLKAVFHPATVKRGLLVSFVVGTILTAINQMDLLLAGQLPPLWTVFLTYFTPYAVSSFSTAMPVKR